jgi:Zn-dependent peptidase ImmA (M78 family)/O-acetyl-ADP-ribose deacetylase (regulator of RNase III)
MTDAIMEDFEHQPLANLMRGISDDEQEPAGEDLRRVLKERGLDSDEVASQVESQVSAFLQRQRPLRTVTPKRKWKHPSVKAFAQGGDAVERMISLASDLALSALEGLTGASPVDPFRLAELRRIPVVPNEAILDARIVPLGADRMQIEFNPNQPRSRIRFSVAHELAHTLLEDCGKAIRNRQPQHKFGPNEWELEMLCNIGAAELLMPIASFPELRGETLNIDTLMHLKDKLEVSPEALLARVVRITSEPCAMFAASRIEDGDFAGRYRVDYTIRSRSWKSPDSSDLLPKRTVVADCTAIGFTAIGDETWPTVGALHVESVGVSPYHGAHFPRVLGIMQSAEQTPSSGVRIVYVKGDATQPRGSGPRIVAHIVNDKALSWGFGFARAIASKWPQAQATFRERVFKDKSAIRLGNTFNTEVGSKLWTFQMVSQHGYGPGSTTRIRYGALKSCLDDLLRFAMERQASVHMPRIGVGYGGGSWGLIERLIDEVLCAHGVEVTVYDLPNSRPSATAPELGLFD